MAIVGIIGISNNGIFIIDAAYHRATLFGGMARGG